jgi:hypothetical protein
MKGILTINNSNKSHTLPPSPLKLAGAPQKKAEAFLRDSFNHGDIFGAFHPAPIFSILQVT